MEIDVAEDAGSFVGLEGDFVVVAEASAMVDPAVGGFDAPASLLDDESTAWLWPGHDLDDGAGLGCGVGDCLAGVAVSTHRWAVVGATRWARRSSFGSAARSWRGWCDEDGDHNPGVSRRMWRLTPLTFVAPWNACGPGDRRWLAEDESTTAAVGTRGLNRRRPRRAVPNTLVVML
jgi:hypothetical protein